MKLQELTMPEIERAIEATQRVTGPDSFSVRVLRRELARRNRAAERAARRQRLARRA